MSNLIFGVQFIQVTGHLNVELGSLFRTIIVHVFLFYLIKILVHTFENHVNSADLRTSFMYPIKAVKHLHKFIVTLEHFHISDLNLKL